MNIVKKVIAPVLLVAGMVACTTEPTRVCEDCSNPDPEPFYGTASVQPTFRSAGPDRLDYRVVLEGNGGSNHWESFDLELNHTEAHQLNANEFQIIHGGFRLMRAGEELIRGTYSGMGIQMSGEVSMVQDWVVTASSAGYSEFVGHSLRAELRQYNFSDFDVLITSANDSASQER